MIAAMACSCERGPGPGTDPAAPHSPPAPAATTSLDLRWTTNARPAPEAAALAASMRGLANQAINTESRTGRAELYGAMLHTCASCHAIVRSHADASSAP